MRNGTAHAFMVATPFLHCTMARRPQGLYTLRNNPDIARFVIEGEANGRQLGTGSYGSVEEVNYKLANY